MTEISLFDESVNKSYSKFYMISIQAGLNGFSFFLFDLYRNKYTGFKYIPLNQSIFDPGAFKEIVKNEEVLNWPVKQVKIISPSFKSTLIPTPLFRENQLDTYFSFNHHIDTSDKILFNKLKHIDAYQLFAVKNDWHDMLGKLFPECIFFHQSVPLFEHFLSSSQSGNGEVIVNIYTDFFDIFYIKNNKLILYNCFTFRDSKDLIYFILYIYEQTLLSPENVPLILNGSIENTSPALEMIKKFIRNVSFFQPGSVFNFSYVFDHVKLHQYTDLLLLKKCG